METVNFDTDARTNDLSADAKVRSLDSKGLAVLKAEMEEDCCIATSATKKARDRFDLGTECGLEACALQLSLPWKNLQILDRRARCDKLEGSLIRTSYDPPLFTVYPLDLSDDLRALRDFRRIVLSQSAWVISRQDIGSVLQIAARVVPRLPFICSEFFRQASLIPS